MKSMYILSYLGGVGEKNLDTEETIAKSLAHFYFHYWLLKFYNYRDLLDRYDTSVLEKGASLWTYLKWTKHHIKIPVGEYNYSAWGIRHKWYNDKGHIRNVKYSGQVTTFEHSEGRRDLSKDLYKLVCKKTNGLTRIGMTLFQESCEAYLRCVLGAQADTRWKIVGDQGRSYQTQDKFYSHLHNLTKFSPDAENSNLLDEVRRAIFDTKVRLDYCINPGIILLPSHMIYISDIPGYNNFLKDPTTNTHFGLNASLNADERQDKRKHNTFEQNADEQNTDEQNSQKLQSNYEKTSQKLRSISENNSQKLRSNPENTSEKNSKDSTQKLQEIYKQKKLRNEILVALLVAIPIYFLI